MNHLPTPVASADGASATSLLGALRHCRTGIVALALAAVRLVVPIIAYKLHERTLTRSCCSGEFLAGSSGLLRLRQLQGVRLPAPLDQSQGHSYER